MYLFVGRNIPPADDDGGCDPYVVVRCAGQKTRSKTCKETLNPGWYETLVLNVKLYPLEKDQLIPSGMFLMLFDEDDSDRHDLLGRIWITLEPDLVLFQHDPNYDPVEVLFRKPKWYNVIYDANDT